MGDHGDDAAQYSIRPPDTAKFRAGAVKVRLHLLDDTPHASYKVKVPHTAKPPSLG